MKHISILIPKDAILGSLEGTRMLFTHINFLLKSKGAQPLFKLQLVGLTKETSICNSIYKIKADVLLENADDTDLIVIPALDGELKHAIEQNKKFIPWIIRQYNLGAEVASLCTGAFLLASTGLLTGKKSSTHWGAANDFKKMFPEVNLVDDKVVTEESGIYTSGGAFSYLNLVLYLIEKYAGREMAVLISKMFAIEIERRSQSPFAIFIGQKDHEDEAVKKAQEFIEANYTDRINVNDLAEMMCLGRRTFERRFKKATTNTVVEYIQRVKIEAAKKKLESSNENVSEVMFSVGYSDGKAFRNTFKKVVGFSPLEYKKKYNHETVFQQ